MTTTLNAAIEEGRKGNWDVAWMIALMDEGMNEDVTKDQWVVFAKNAIARRDAEASRLERTDTAYYRAFHS